MGAVFIPQRLHLVAGARRDRPGRPRDPAPARFPRAAGALLTGRARRRRSGRLTPWRPRRSTGRSGRASPSRRSSAGTCAGSAACCRAPGSAGSAGPAGSRCAPFPWHYWWQAHLLDCLVDAQLRAPDRAPGGHHRDAHPRRPAAQRRVLGQPLLRRHRLARPGRAAGRHADPPVRAVRARPRSRPGWTRAGPRTAAAASGGAGDDDFKNAPANGPAAILLARTGQLGFADGHRGLDGRGAARPGLRPGPRRRAAGSGRLRARGRAA